MAPRCEDPKLITGAINLELVQPICFGTSTLRTDGQTDGRLIVAIIKQLGGALHIERFLRRRTRSGFYRPDWPSVEILAEDAADALFRRVLGNRNHLLHLLLPDKNMHGYDLRHRRHDRILAPNHDDTTSEIL